MATETHQTTLPEIVFTITPEEIAADAAEFGKLVAKGPRDRAGLRKIRAARVKLHAKLRTIAKDQRDLKAPALAYEDEVNAKARELREAVERIQAHLVAQEKAVKDQETQQQRAALEDRGRVMRLRSAALVAAGDTKSTPADFAHLDDDEFAEYLAARTTAKAVG